MDIQEVKRIIRELKEAGVSIEYDGGQIVSIPYNYTVIMPECVNLLSKWRIENPSLSPSRFPISDRRTATWLEKCVLQNELRELFMIRNDLGYNIGHIGISSIDVSRSLVRIDSVMKGEKNVEPGIMRKVVKRMKLWCKEELKANCVDLVVLDDNQRAIMLYKDCGFSIDGVIPLRRVEKNGEISWIEDYSLELPEKQYFHMFSFL